MRCAKSTEEKHWCRIRKVKKKGTSLYSIVAVVLITAAAVFLVRHFHIKDFHIVSPGVLYTSGQPRGMDYTRLLYKYHIATIVNVRSAAEHRERNWHNEEITWVRSNGVKYSEFPLDRDVNNPGYFPDADMRRRFLEIMAGRENLPVLIHGSSGRGRVAMLTSVWLVKGEKCGAEKAIKIAEQVKTRPLAAKELAFVRGLAN